MTEEVEIGMTVTIPGTFGNVKVHIRREKLDEETNEQHRKRVRDEVRTEIKRQILVLRCETMASSKDGTRRWKSSAMEEVHRHVPMSRLRKIKEKSSIISDNKLVIYDFCECGAIRRSNTYEGGKTRPMEIEWGEWIESP